jgi:hypothetical protein
LAVDVVGEGLHILLPKGHWQTSCQWHKMLVVC